MRFRLLIVGFLLFWSTTSYSYPSAEITASGGPPFNFGVSGTLSGFLLIDNDTLVLAYSEKLAVVDMDRFALAASQPAALSTTDKTNGTLMGIAYDSTGNDIIASQNDGDVLIFDLDNITATPTSITVSAKDELGQIAVDSTTRQAYVVNNTDKVIVIVNLATKTVEASTVSLSSVGSSFSIKDALFHAASSQFFFSTSNGKILVVQSGKTQTTTIDVGSNLTLEAMAITPGGEHLYVVDSTTPKLAKILLSSKTLVTGGTTLGLSANATPTDIAITNVKNPVNGTAETPYAFVAGSKGITVMNTVNDEIFDLGTTTTTQEPIPTSAVPKFLAASTSVDGYVYLGNSTGTVGVLSANPWITISSLTFVSGKTSLGTGDTFTLNFQSTKAGTFEVRVGGDVSANGKLFTPVGGGSSSGTVSTANTAMTTMADYDTNSSLFSEGTNKLFIFVTDSAGNRGRRATTFTVDTPPPLVTIQSTGFGNKKLYVTFTRLTQADIKHYRIYLSTDAAGVLTKTTVDSTIAQPSSGDTATATVEGLSNGTTYFIAMEAVDNAGNVSASRTTTLASGVSASATPQATGGPIALSGETGCTLNPHATADRSFSFFLLFVPLLLLSCRYRFMIVLIFLFSLCSLVTTANAETKPLFLGSFEVKTGFWMPASEALDTFYNPCCNLITKIQGGILFQKRYGIEAGVGFHYKSGSALGVTNGATSQDQFKLFFIPVETSFVWRLDYAPWRWVIPYFRVGTDYVYFRENTAGERIQGIKYGAHGGGGVSITLTEFGDGNIREDLGIEDFFLTLEAQYNWINNFGKRTGLNLSGPVYSAGLLFLF